MENSIEYSLDTPKYFDNNILNSKILNIIKNNNQYGYQYGYQYGGNGFDTSNCVCLIIGIMFIIIGFGLYLVKNDWIEAEASITNTNCYDSTEQCDMVITYSVDSIQYSKVVTTLKSNIPSGSKVSVYYQETNPNIVRLYNFSYMMLGIGLIVFGIFVLILSLSCTENYSDPSNILNSDSNLYTSTRNSHGMNIVYTK